MEQSSGHEQLDTSLEEGEISPYYQDVSSSQDYYESHEQQLPSSDKEGYYQDYEAPSSHRVQDLSSHDRPREAGTSSRRKERRKRVEPQVNSSLYTYIYICTIV